MNKLVCVTACFLVCLAAPRLGHSVEPTEGPNPPPDKAEGSTDNPGRQALHDAMEGFSGILKQWLMENNVAQIALGNISNPPNASAGLLVHDALTAALKTEDIQLASEAQYQLRGDYYVDKAHNGTVSFNFEVVDTQDNNKERMKWPHLETTGKPEDVLVLLGLTAGPGTISPSDSLLQNRPPLDPEVVANPAAQFVIDGNAVLEAKERKFGIEINVKRDREYSAAKPEQQGPYAYVDIPEECVYSVVLINNSNHPVAVQLLIDGLSIFSYQNRDDAPNRAAFTHTIIEGKRGVIVGWYISAKQAREFLVKGPGAQNLNASTAQQAQADSSRLGTVTALFHRAYKPGEEPAKARLRGMRGKQSVQGNQIDANYKIVNYTWDATATAAVSVRYDK